MIESSERGRGQVAPDEQLAVGDPPLGLASIVGENPAEALVIEQTKQGVRMFTADIKGKTWTIEVVQKLKVQGDCNREDRVIRLSATDLSETLVRHEITHAFFTECCVCFTELEAPQVEEIFCEIVAQHLEDISRLSRQIFYTALREIR